MAVDAAADAALHTLSARMLDLQGEALAVDPAAAAETRRAEVVLESETAMNLL